MLGQALLKEVPERRGAYGTGRPYLSIRNGVRLISKDHSHKGTAGDPSSVTWIVVANGCRARLFEKAGKDAAIRPAVSHDLYGDAGLPGRRDRTMSMQSFREPSDDDQKREFARAVARHLEQCFAEGCFDHLVLVAPPQTLGVLKGALPAALRTRVKCDIQRNLMNAASLEIAEYLGAALRD